MNYATRSRLAVLLTISVVAFGHGIVFADAASDYETIFGAEGKKVAASSSKSDDVAFAAKLLKAAKDMPDSPAMQVLLYEKASQFGSAGPADCDTALEALGLLEKAVPDKKELWQQKKFAIVKLRYDKSYGAARKAAGPPYVEMLEALADAKVAEGNGIAAKALYKRAVMVAKYIRSPRAVEILAKSKAASAAIAREAKLKSLQTKLTADPKDTTVRKELILFYVTALDNPAEAAKLLTDDLDEVTRTYVPLAAKSLDGLGEAICLELGDWYHQKLSKTASVVRKSVVLQRAQGYYQQFLESHTKKDAQSYRAKAALEAIEKELAKLGTAAIRISPPEGRTLILNLGKGVTMKFVRIPAGKFIMGSPGSERGRKGTEGPQRQVTISKPFYIGVSEVTQAQYQSVMGKNPSKFKGVRNPVDSVSWVDAVAFCTALSAKVGRAAGLPTEAQWEYACRAGTKTCFSFGAEIKGFDAHGWCKANSGGKSHPVGLKRPNRAGLYDMHGNLWEWCRDYHNAKFYAKAKNVDPENTAKARHRVARGGSWRDNPDWSRSARRGEASSTQRHSTIGFRVVIGAGGKPKPLPTPKVASSGKEITLNLGNGVTMKLVRIPAGKFLMGSPETEKDRRKDEGPQRRVTISKAFYMGVTEVTQAQYESVMGKNPSRHKNPQNPVEQVSWDDATAFCEALSKNTRRTAGLPTEAQWEYACRAGAKTRFSFGDDTKDLTAHGWYKAGSGRRPHRVGQKKPNALGLYDMHGNVYEWCRDWYDPKFYVNSKRVDPENTTAAKHRVMRSGSFFSDSRACRNANRGSSASVGRYIGFRVVVVSDSGVK
jgi:formylglycine-generating enzyme required for sulfatase activity